MKAIIIYKSNTGFTKQYAEWIAQALACEAVPVDRAKGVDFSAYDTVVFGGWICAGSLQGFKAIREKLQAFGGKKAVFACGSAPVDDPHATAFLDTGFTAQERSQMGIFYFPGGLNYAKMGGIHKIMMKMMCSVMKKQNGIDSPQYKLLSQSFDATNRAAITPLLEYVRES